MNIFTKLFSSSLLCLALLTACNSGENISVQPQTAGISGSTIAFDIPDRIRTSQAVNLEATTATITTSAGEVTMERNGDQFIGSIDVEPGSLFTFNMTISENVDGQSIEYVSVNGGIEEPIDRDVEIVVSFDERNYTDTDGDGFDNLEEVNAGSDHQNSFSTPDDPDGMPPSEGQLDFSASTFTVTEADGELVIPVTRTGGSDGRVTANYNFQNESAIRGQDFTAANGQLVWEDGDSDPQNITVTILADDLNDGEHTFTASLFNATGGAGIGNGFTRITIEDSTPPAQRGTIQLTTTQISINEDAGNAIIEVERVNGSDGVVAIDYATTPGSAGENDFTARTVERGIVWADGEDGTRTISIPITNDTEVESDETFTLSLSNSIGGATLGQSTITVTILDTSPVPVTGQISLAQSNYTVSEGNTINIEVSRQEGTDGAASIDYTVTTDTADDDDFTATNGTLDWADGDSGARTITISALTDDELEAAETVVVTLENANGADLGVSSATVTITDSTVAAPGTIAFSTASGVVDEGDSIDINVSRTGGSDGEVQVDVTTSSDDYTIDTTELVWVHGDSSDKTITLSTSADDITDDTEVVSVTLSNATGNATIGTATFAVTVNDTTPPAEPDQPTEFFATDGEWEVCVAPFNNSSTSAFATQLSANEGRIVTCIKTCDIGGMILDDAFPGWGWNPIDQHSCTTARDAEGTYTSVPIYTPMREEINLNLSTPPFTRGNSIWACVNETRQNAEFTYTTDTSVTIWYQFLDDGTYFYGTSDDGSQPASLIGPETWSVNGRILEIGHLGTGYRNTLFFPGNQTLHIHPTTDDRLSCTRETRPASAAVQ